MAKNNRHATVNTMSRWFGDNKSAYIAIIILTILLVITGIILYKRLQNTKFELESCRSSCSS